MKNRISIIFFLFAISLLFNVFPSDVAAQQTGTDFRSQAYTKAIDDIIAISEGQLGREEIIKQLAAQSDPVNLSNATSSILDLFIVYPEVVLVSHDGNESAVFYYYMNPEPINTVLIFDFSNTPDWVDTLSLVIDTVANSFTINVFENTEPLARLAPFKVIGLLEGTVDTCTAYILQAPAPQTFLFVTPDYLAMPPEGGTTPPFTITHHGLNDGWEVLIDDDWISIDSGSLSTNLISFIIESNQDNVARLGIIEIKALEYPEIKDEITIIQHATDLQYLIVSPKNIYVDPDGGDLEVLVFTNLESWSTQILENPGGMIAGTTQSPGGDSLTISVAQNPTANQRMARLVISGGEPLLSDTIRIYQSAPYIILNPREKLLACTGSNFGVNVIRFGVNEIVFGGNPDWVSVDIINNDSIHIAVEPNPTDQTRTGIVSISSASNPSVSDQVQIIQYACTQAYIILSPHQQVANWNDTILADPFIITSNNTGELSATTSAFWLDAIIDGDSLFVTLDINESNTLRSAEITVFDISNPALSDAVTVIQAGTQTFILVTPEFQSISHTGGLTEAYTVFSLNVEDWEVHFESIPPWIIDTQIAGNQIIFNLAANGTPDLRQATFRVRDVSNPELYAEALILQEAATESLLFLTPRHKQLPHAANPLVNFQVTSLNVDLWETDAASVPEWITVNSSDQSTLSLNVSENTLPETRSAIIRIYDNSNPAVNDSVFIFQYSALNSYLLAAPREQWVPHEGNDDLHFLITAVNVESWEADLDGIDWIIQNTSGPDTLSLNVSENTLPETRSAIIFLYDTSNPAVKDSVFVFQYSAIDSYLLAAPREQVVGHMGNDNVEFQITRVNVDEWEYDSATVPSWISVTNSGGEILALSIAPNESMQLRQATIHIFATNQTGIEDFVSIYQLAGTESYLIASPRTRLVPHYGDDEVDFAITMVNIDGWEFTNTTPYEDWIVFQNLGDSIMRLSVAENTQALPREARIVIQATDDATIKDSVNVFQYSSLDSYIIVEPREQQTANYLADTLTFSVIPVNVSSLSFEVYYSSHPEMIDPDNSGLMDSQLTIVVNQNNSQQPREARIRVFDADNPEVSDTAFVYQSYAYIIISPGAVSNISWNGAIVKIKSFSNISGYFAIKGHGYEWYDLSKDAVNWSDDPVLLSGNDSVYLRVQENTNAFQNRSSYLNFQSGGVIYNTFWFTQNANDGTSYTVSGRVLIEGDEDQPLAGVKVVLYDSIIITNAMGRYQHNNVPENWTGTITPLIDISLPIPYYFFPQIIEITGAGITGDTVVQDFAAYRIEPNVVISPKTTTICDGEMLHPGSAGYPSASISNTFGPSTYFWTSDPVDSVLLENPNVLYPVFGPKQTTTYWLEVNNYFRTTIDSFTIVVNQLPASVDFEGSLIVCRKQAGVVYQVLDPPPGVYYSWKLDSENPGAYFINSHTQNSVAGNIAIVNWGSNPGNFNLSLFAYNSSDCAADPVIKSIEVTATEATPPTTVLRKSDDNMLYATDTLASSYQWGWFVKNELGELMQEYMIPDKSEWYCRLPVGHVYNPLLYHYFVITYNEDGSCGSRSFHNVPVGFEEAERDAITIYPNPNSGVFVVKLNNARNLHNSTLEVYNNLGQMVLSKEMNSAANEQIIDLSNRGRVTPGVYMVLLRAQGAVISTKIIVQ
jgi:hypothetical protein